MARVPRPLTLSGCRTTRARRPRCYGDSAQTRARYMNHRQTICQCCSLSAIFASRLLPRFLRRGGRVVEGGGLLNRYRGLKPLSRVQIPPSPPILNSAILVRRGVLREEGFDNQFPRTAKLDAQRAPPISKSCFQTHASSQLHTYPLRDMEGRPHSCRVFFLSPSIWPHPPHTRCRSHSPQLEPPY